MVWLYIYIDMSDIEILKHSYPIDSCGVYESDSYIFFLRNSLKWNQKEME